MVSLNSHGLTGNKRSGFLTAVVTATFLLLPVTHFKWLPNLGGTRPISAVLFVLAFLLIFFRYNMAGKIALPMVPGWDSVRWMGVLLFMGLVSSVFVVFYGDFAQAIARCLGYFIIFAIMYITSYAIGHYGWQQVVEWIAWGYVPIIFFGFIETLVIVGLHGFEPIILVFRKFLVVRADWSNRVCFLANEPSFLAFQMLLLIMITPHIKKPMLKKIIVFGIAIIVLFSKSVTVFISMAIYFIARLLFGSNMKVKILVLVGGISIPYFLLQNIKRLFPSVSVLQRLSSLLMDVSFQIRFNHFLNLLYSMKETLGGGLGIGQYGAFWKNIFISNIDYQSFDQYGEVATILASDTYMKPWSVIFGIGVDLGVLGLLVIALMLWYTFKAAITPHRKAVMLASTIMLMGAYPIVTPHLWIVLAFMLSTSGIAGLKKERGNKASGLI